MIQIAVYLKAGMLKPLPRVWSFFLMLCFGFYRLLSLIRCTAVNARHALISLQTLVGSVYTCIYKFSIKYIHCMLSSH